MANNLGYTPGTGATLRTTDVGGVHYPAGTLFDEAGNALASAITTPGTSDRGLVVRQAGAVDVHNPDSTGTGTITATDAVVAAPAGDGTLRTGASTAGSLVALATPGGDASWTVAITGTWTGTLYYEASLDSTNGTDGNWTNVNGRMTGIVNTVLSGSATANGIYRGNTSAIAYLRVRAVGALTGTPTVRIRISAGPGAVFLNASTPAGTNAMGAVYLGTNTGKTQVGKPGTLVSTAVTANQVVTGATHTVAAGKVLYLTAATVSARLTTFAATATNFGTASLRIGGAAVGTWAISGAGIYLLDALQFPEPLFATAAQVVEWVVTPAATTSYTWHANLLGYER